jgi:hypothetical protein
MVMGINTLSYPLVSYTIGRMNSSNCYVNDFAVWAVFMLLLLGSTDNLTVCRLDDIDNWKSIYVKYIFKGFLVVYIVVDITLWQNRRPFPYLRPLLAILSVGVLKCYVRIASMRMVSKSYLNKNMKVIAEYMENVDNLQPGSFDPVTMEGYKYMVAGEKYCIKRSSRKPWYKEESSKVITVEQIWQCTGNLLLPERRGMSLKDVCLSMALSKMLNRRFAGFKLSEAGLEKTHDFVFKGLLVAGDKPYQRAFRVIEEELVFVHDLYYTRHSYLYQKGRYLPLYLPIMMCGLCLWLTYLIVRDGSPSLSRLTIFITVVLAFLEAYQLYLYLASGWFKVALIRSYVKTPLSQRSGCFLEMIIGLLLSPKAFRPWKKRLGQYSILWEIGRKSGARNCLHYATLRLVEKKAKKGRKKSVKLSENVKKAVVESLLRSNGLLTSGVTSLRNNGVDCLLPAWACDATATDGSITRTILAWHVATTLCKHQLDSQAKEEEDDAKREDDTVTTATTLSQYCMHLLAFAPDLLPDHSSISESILDQTIEEAGKILIGYKKKENWCDELLKNSTHNGDGDEAQLFVKGVQLASHLIEDIQESALRWKVLSDFWAEMMLYVSPSDDARAHLEALARGGEFITHLWALLTHAGILNRGPTGP